MFHSLQISEEESSTLDLYDVTPMSKFLTGTICMIIVVYISLKMPYSYFSICMIAFYYTHEWYTYMCIYLYVWILNIYIFTAYYEQIEEAPGPRCSEDEDEEPYAARIMEGSFANIHEYPWQVGINIQINKGVVLTNVCQIYISTHLLYFILR